MALGLLFTKVRDPMNAFQRAFGCAAALLVTSLLTTFAMSATPVYPAYTSFLLSVSYVCPPTTIGARQLLEAAVSANTIKYIVSDVTTGVSGCNRNGFIFFGTPALPPGEYAIQVRTKSGGAVAGNRDETVTVGAAPPTTTVFTLFHPPSNTFFATASLLDRNQLLALGWQAADGGFNVWPVSGPVPSVAKAVCRFYYAARSTHFYTASAADCTALKGTAGFAYEGIAFYALVPVGGRCGLGTKAVYRIFDPVRVNHRYTDNADTVTGTLLSYAQQENEQVALPDTIIPGTWRDDGIAFCSPIQ